MQDTYKHLPTNLVLPGGPGEPGGPGKNRGDDMIFSLVIRTGTSALFDSKAILETRWIMNNNKTKWQ